MKPWSLGWLIAAGAYPGFCSMKRQASFALKNLTKVRQNRHFRQADCALTNLTKICQNRQLHSARDAA